MITSLFISYRSRVSHHKYHHHVICCAITRIAEKVIIYFCSKYYKRLRGVLQGGFGGLNSSAGLACRSCQLYLVCDTFPQGHKTRFGCTPTSNCSRHLLWSHKTQIEVELLNFAHPAKFFRWVKFYFQFPMPLPD